MIERICPNCNGTKFHERFKEPPRAGGLAAQGVTALECLTGDYELFLRSIIDEQSTIVYETIYEVFVFPDVRIRLGSLYTVIGEEKYGRNYQYRMSVPELKRIGTNWRQLRNLI